MQRLKQQTISKLNSILHNQKETISQMNLFADQDQDDTLHSRANVNKINYTCLQKIDQAEDVMKQARNLQARSQLTSKNGVSRRLEPQFDVRQTPTRNINELNNQPRSRSNPTIEADMISRNRLNQKLVDRSNNKTEMESINRTRWADKERQTAEKPVIPHQLMEGTLNKSVLMIEHTIVKNYFGSKLKQISGDTTPEQIFKTFNPFYELCGIQLTIPLIKKYKNCLYFGESMKREDIKYQGFLVFFNEGKIYYGELVKQKKNGQGVQIDFKSDIIYIGSFDRGRKNGDFVVIKKNEQYKGKLNKGQYHGYGELTTDFSVYKGEFEMGERHGQGQEYFIKSGLTISGIFVHNKFISNSNSIEPERAENSRNTTINSNAFTIRSHKKVSISRDFNPQSSMADRNDKNVVFEPSSYNNHNYQQFNFEFGEVQDDTDNYEFAVKKAPAFRIKQGRQQRSLMNSERRRSISEDHPALQFNRK